jgi:hypothetical protein
VTDMPADNQIAAASDDLCGAAVESDSQAPTPARIVDVARLAEVSIATVSRTISRPEMVAEESRRRVWAAVNALSYSPNPVAQALRGLGRRHARPADTPPARE